MTKITDLQWKDIIRIRLYSWIQRISGKPITSKQSEQVEEIVEQTLENKQRYKKIKVDNLR